MTITDDVIAKLKGYSTLPEWAGGPINPAEAGLLVQVVADLRKNEEIRAGIIRELRAELKASRTWGVAPCGGRYCETCEQEVRRGEAYKEQPGTGGLIQHVHCRDLEVRP
jgi:hypothetical protein